MNKSIISKSIYRIVKIVSFIIALIDAFIYFIFVAKSNVPLLLQAGLLFVIMILSVFFIIYFATEKSVLWMVFAPFLLFPISLINGYLAAIILFSVPIGLLFLSVIAIIVVRDAIENIQVLPERIVFVLIVFFLFWTTMYIFNFYLVNEYVIGIIGLLSGIMAYIALKRHFAEKIRNPYISTAIVLITIPLSIFIFFTSVRKVFPSDPAFVDTITEKTKDGDKITEKHTVDHGVLASENYYTRTSERLFVFFEKVEYTNNVRD